MLNDCYPIISGKVKCPPKLRECFRNMWELLTVSTPMSQENRRRTAHICAFIIYKYFIYLLANKAVDLADLKHFCNRFVVVQ